MLIKKKSGNITDITIKGRIIDFLQIEWYETNKRILHKQTNAGRNIVMKFLNESPNLMQGDVIFEDDKYIVAIDIQPCESIIVKPTCMQQMASLCYEIGNKHLPLFLQGEEVLVPYEAPLYRMLMASGFNPALEKRKLLHPVKTTVSPHGQSGNGTLLSKILQLTKSPADV